MFFYFRFVVMPTNSTNLTQPLDVGVFRGMKSRWRNQLLAYREVHPTGAILKSEFPNMLKTLCSDTRKETIIGSFKSTGIYPLARKQVLKRIPNKDNVSH